MKRLETKVVLIYSGSREYTKKDGTKGTIYKFSNESGYIEGTLSTMENPELKQNSAYLCTLVCGDRWNNDLHRYLGYSYVKDATPYKK